MQHLDCIRSLERWARKSGGKVAEIQCPCLFVWDIFLALFLTFLSVGSQGKFEPFALAPGPARNGVRFCSWPSSRSGVTSWRGAQPACNACTRRSGRAASAQSWTARTSRTTSHTAAERVSGSSGSSSQPLPCSDGPRVFIVGTSVGRWGLWPPGCIRCCLWQAFHCTPANERSHSISRCHPGAEGARPRTMRLARYRPQVSDSAAACRHRCGH